MPVMEPIYLSTSEPEEHDDYIEPPDMNDDGDDDGDGDGDADDGGPERWVTIATFWQAPEAHIARLKLESEQIDCVLIDEYLVATDWLYANAVGGIKLRVREEDARRAKEILDRRQPQIARTAQQDRDNPSTPGDLAQASGRCPECGSLQVHRPLLLRRNAWAVVAMMLLTGTVLLFALPVLVVVYFVWLRPYHCRACDNVWTSSSPRRGFDVTLPPGA